MAYSIYNKLLIWSWGCESDEDVMSGFLERSERRAKEVSESKDKLDTAMKALTCSMEEFEGRYDCLDKLMDESFHSIDKFVKSFKPSLSIILIPFIAEKTDFEKDPQLSHAWRKSRNKAEKPKVKLRYNFCVINFMCPLSNSVSAQSSSASHDKLRRAWVRYKVPC